MNEKINTIVLTSGEPAGIGPDILVYLAQKEWPVRLVACVDPLLLKDRAKILGLELNLCLFNLNSKIQPKKTLLFIPIQLVAPVEIGKLNKKNSSYVINTLNKACYLCENIGFSALVTGPVQKSIINEAGINFIGHTEFLANRSKIKNTVMMFVKNDIRLALATTHIPIKNVSKKITFNYLFDIICILNNELKLKFCIKNPSIYICGLNPHAGENGYIGSEENEIIIPVINKLKLKGLNLHGPFSADSVFQKKYFNKSDVILSMYHDQGLSVFKYLNFNNSVNVTLGLPFIRTSVDHGTALNLAGTRMVNPQSFILALELAICMLENLNEQKNI